MVGVSEKIQLNETYKYLGILQAEDIKHKEVKKSVRGKYIRRVQKVVKSKLNAGNNAQAMNTWAVPVIKCTAGIIDWTKAELEDMNRRTRKLMTAFRTLHPQSDVDRLYLPWCSGGRGLQQVQQVVNEETWNIAECQEKQGTCSAKSARPTAV